MEGEPIWCVAMRHTEKHAVLVRVRLSDNALGDSGDDQLVDSLDDLIRAAIERPPRVGVWDGHEFGSGWAVIFCYGRDAAALTARITSALFPFKCARPLHLISVDHAPDTLDSVIVFDVAGTGEH
jgi:hypothetical protein